MKITHTTSMDEMQTKLVKKLIKICQKVDNTFKEPYLLNILNFDKQMPAFFLGYEDSKLIGFLSVYADTKDPELSIFIHPEYRRTGYATKLSQDFLSETKSYHLNSVKFQTEANFSNHNPEFIENLNLVSDNETETWMTRTGESFELLEKNGYVIREASKAFSLQIAKLQSIIFSEDLKVSEKYVNEAINDETGTLYMVLSNDKVIATCTVDKSSDYIYLYGLAVLNTYQRQGIGTYFMKKLINIEIEKTSKVFQIAVADSNVVAKRMYERLGFLFQTQVLYLKIGNK